MVKYKKFANYKRCTACDKTFRNYENPHTCPFCNETKYVKDLFEKENNENN